MSAIFFACKTIIFCDTFYGATVTAQTVLVFRWLYLISACFIIIIIFLLLFFFAYYYLHSKVVTYIQMNTTMLKICSKKYVTFDYNHPVLQFLQFN